jgi:hypothetical protein
MEQLRRQATDALARYDQAVHDAGGQQRFVPTGELTGQVGDWEVAVGDNNKLALLSGHAVAAQALPEALAATGKVVWDSGATETFPLISANQALNEMVQAGRDCDGCTPLEITGARLTTVRLETTRGPATVPAWEYAIKGTAVKATRVAVDRSNTVKVTPPSWDPYNAPGGLAIESATVTTPTQLTVAFTGSPGSGDKPCGADYSAEVVESANAVVVIVITHPHGSGEMCALIGARRTATVELAQPLGERAVLEVQQGMPVPLTIARA